MVHNDKTEQSHNIIKQQFIEIPQVTVDTRFKDSDERSMNSSMHTPVHYCNSYNHHGPEPAAGSCTWGRSELLGHSSQRLPAQ